MVAAGEVLTVAEVAAVLKVAPSTVYKLVDAGRLEHFRVSNAIRVPLSALDRLRDPAAKVTQRRS